MTAVHVAAFALGATFFLAGLVAFATWALESLFEGLALVFGVLAFVLVPALLISWALL